MTWIGLAVAPVCALVGWWLYLRLARHIYDTGGADDLQVLGELGDRYGGRRSWRADRGAQPTDDKPDGSTSGCVDR
jgi:hypothetical protein